MKKIISLMFLLLIVLIVGCNTQISIPGCAYYVTDEDIDNYACFESCESGLEKDLDMVCFGRAGERIRVDVMFND